MQVPNKFELSIKAAGMTNSQAQETLDFRSYQALSDRLKNPGIFRLRELKVLRDSMSEQGSKMLMDAIADFFCTED